LGISVEKLQLPNDVKEAEASSPENYFRLFINCFGDLKNYFGVCSKRF
jgi:hypothetical protein